MIDSSHDLSHVIRAKQKYELSQVSRFNFLNENCFYDSSQTNLWFELMHLMIRVMWGVESSHTLSVKIQFWNLLMIRVKIFRTKIIGKAKFHDSSQAFILLESFIKKYLDSSLKIYDLNLFRLTFGQRHDLCIQNIF